AVMKIARGPVVLPPVIVFLQLLIQFGDQAIVSLIRAAVGWLQPWNGFEIDFFLEYHMFAVAFSRSPCHKREIHLGNITVMKERLAQVGLIKNNFLRLRKFR